MTRYCVLLTLVLCLLGMASGYEFRADGYSIENYAKYTSKTPPNRLVFDDSGNLYLNHHDDGKVVKVDSNRKSSTLATGLDKNFDIKWGGSTEYGGNLYLTRAQGDFADKVWKISPEGKVSSFAAMKPPAHAPGALAIDTVGKYGGEMYVGTTGQDKLYKVDYTGKVSLFSKWPGWTDKGGVFGLEFDTTGKFGGKMFACTSFRAPNSHISGLFTVEPDGKVSRFCDEIVSAGTIGFDKAKTYFDGDMFVTGRTSYDSKNALWRVKADGTCKEFMSNVRTFCFGNDGALYVTSYDSSSRKVDVSRVAVGPSIEVISTEPASPAVLMPGQRLYVKFRYDSGGAETIQTWVGPAHGVKGCKSHPCRPITDKVGTYEGWFFFDDNDAHIKDIKISMRDTSKKTGYICTKTIPVDFKWQTPKGDGVLRFAVPGTAVKMLSSEPALPAVLKTGEDLKIKFQYDAADAKSVTIMTWPNNENQCFPAGYKCKKTAGVYEYTKRYNKPETLKNVKFRLTDNTTNRVLIEQDFPVNVRWQATKAVAKPLVRPTGRIKQPIERVTPATMKIIKPGKLLAPVKTRHIKPDGKGGLPTIQAAVNASASGDQIVLSAGIYTGDGNRDIDFGGKAITIRSTNPENPSVVAATVIDCQGSKAEPHRAFHFHSGEGEKSVVKGLTIKNGFAKIMPYQGREESVGGAILCESSSPSIVNCTFVNNHADCGKRPSRGPTCGKGGAIFLKNNSNASLTNCTFSENNASWGGAVYSGHSSTPKLSMCKFVNNTAALGGAIFNYYSETVASNCSFVNNRASYHYGGGATYNQSCSVVFYNCTFFGNQCPTGGGAISHSGGGTCTIKNCILWRNSMVKIALRHSSTIDIDYCNLEGGKAGISKGPKDNTVNWGRCNIEVDPRFVAANGRDIHLLPDSPCINVGDPDYAAGTGETDLGGNLRVLNGRIDMGAYETADKGGSRIKPIHKVASKTTPRASDVIDSRIAAKYAKRYEGMWVYKLKDAKGKRGKDIILLGKINDSGQLRFSFLDQLTYSGAVFEKCSVDQLRANVYFKLPNNRSVMYSLTPNKKRLSGTIYSSWTKEQRISLRKITLVETIKTIENNSHIINRLTKSVKNVQACAKLEKNKHAAETKKLGIELKEINDQNFIFKKQLEKLQREHLRATSENKKTVSKLNTQLNEARNLKLAAEKQYQSRITKLKDKVSAICDELDDITSEFAPPANVQDIISRGITLGAVDQEVSRIVPAYGCYVWEVLYDLPEGTNMRVRSKHAEPGRKGAFSLTAWSDTNDDGVPDKCLGTSPLMTAEKKDDWSSWEFVTDGKKVFVGMTLKTNTSIYYQNKTKPKGYFGLSDKVYYAKPAGGKPVKSVQPRYINLRVEILESDK